ncbi:hypothetical protein, partial [Burkholderia multivorans]|uniref:hypothetical protein n=1 Tax=Burkholderia multivorans TaxID=87883 RepID=UPI001C65B702
MRAVDGERVLVAEDVDEEDDDEADDDHGTGPQGRVELLRLRLFGQRDAVLAHRLPSYVEPAPVTRPRRKPAPQHRCIVGRMRPNQN